MTLNGISRLLFRSARLSRDLNAVRRGPRAVGKRLARKAAGRAFGKVMGRLG